MGNNIQNLITSKSRQALALTMAVSALLMGCNDDTTPYDSYSNSLQLRAMKGEASVVAIGSRSVPPNSYFTPGTSYRMWVYDALPDATGELPTVASLLLDGSQTSDLVTESNNNYLILPSDKDRIVRQQRTIYGFTDGTSTPPLQDEAWATSADLWREVPIEYSSYQVSAVRETNTTVNGAKTTVIKRYDQGYTDYCRGYLEYNGGEANTGIVEVPFRHILSQVEVTVIQQGKVATSGTTAYDLRIKSIGLTDLYYEAKYDIKDDLLTVDQTKTRQRDFLSYRHADQYDENNGADSPYQPVDIPLATNDDDETNIQEMTYTMPQPKRTTDNPVYIRLLVQGTDIQSFISDDKVKWTDETSKNEIEVKIPILDNDGNAISFEANTRYELVVTFTGNAVNIVTLTASVYPFFDGETSSSDEDGYYEEAATGQPLVFSDLQWNDRYMGARIAKAKNTLESFVKSTGYYYQKDRSIPYFPARYVGGWLIDTEGNYLNPAEVDPYDLYGETVYPSIVKTNPINNVYGIYCENWWDNINYRIGVQGGKIYYRTGGEWQDIQDPEKWLNRPMVVPIVSYNLSIDQQLALLNEDHWVGWYDNAQHYLSTTGAWTDDEEIGIDAPWYKQDIGIIWGDEAKRCVKDENDNYIAKTVDVYTADYSVINSNYEGYVYDYQRFTAIFQHDVFDNPNDYCCKVEDYIGADGKSVAKSTIEYNGDYINKSMRYVACMANTPSYLWRDHEDEQPCPPGWRLPTMEEFNTILPSCPAAGNLCFISSFYSGDGTIGSETSNTFEELGSDVKELYVKVPIDKTQPDSCMYPYYTSGLYQDLDLNSTEMNPVGDPSVGQQSEYIISQRLFTATEYAGLDQAIKDKISLDDYVALGDRVSKILGTEANPINRPLDTTLNIGLPWGIIYGIKNVGQADAYRMRWHVERVVEGRDIYQLVIDKYKAGKDDRLLFDIAYINNYQYYMNYEWEHPDATMYIPITGIVADYSLPRYGFIGGGVYNYGTETLLMSSSYAYYNGAPRQAAYRIKITGSNRASLFLYPSYAKLEQGGQVRPVRTARGDNQPSTLR